jgi:hypothetical protein
MGTTTETALSSIQRRLLTSDFRTQEGAEAFVRTCSSRYPGERIEAAKSPIPGTWAAFLLQEGVTAYGADHFSAAQDEALERVRAFTAGYCAGLIAGLRL